MDETSSLNSDQSISIDSPALRLAGKLLLWSVLSVDALAILGVGSVVAKITYDECKPMRANDVFSSIDGYKVTSHRKLSRADATTVDNFRASYENYDAQRKATNIEGDIFQLEADLLPIQFSKIKETKPATSDEIVQMARDPNTRDEMLRYSYRDYVDHVRGLPDLESKALAVQWWSNYLLPYNAQTEVSDSYGHQIYHAAFETLRKGGVCIDIALAKYEMLLDAGFSAKNMAVMTVQNQEDDGMPAHAVVIVRLKDGDYVMNNSYIKPDLSMDDIQFDIDLKRVDQFLRSNKIIKQGNTAVIADVSKDYHLGALLLRPVITYGVQGINVYDPLPREHYH